MPTPRTRKGVPAKSTTGAASAPSTVKQTVAATQVVCPAAPRRHAAVGSRETHGAVFTGPITSVSQLTNGGRSVAKGSLGSFDTIEAYRQYIRGLNLAELRRHAREEARIVPIDDSERLIRRLETEWTATAARYPGRAKQAIPARTPFTGAQIEAQAELKRQLLRQ